MSEALNISITTVYKLKKITFSNIRALITNQLIQNSDKKITYEEYLDYLMQLWMRNGYIKRKVR